MVQLVVVKVAGCLRHLNMLPKMGELLGNKITLIKGKMVIAEHLVYVVKAFGYPRINHMLKLLVMIYQ